MSERYVLVRWLLTPPIVVLVFIISGVLTYEYLLFSFFYYWFEPVAGFIAAFFVVITAYISAPKAKARAVAITYIIGVVCAWYLLADSFYPEQHPKAYQPTYIPLIATYTGGLLGVILCFVIEKLRS